jgi:lipoyl(octanoyl) transferase
MTPEMPRAWAVVVERPQPFDVLVRAQDRLVALRAEDRIPDTVLLAQHQPVITLGRRGRTGHVLVSVDELRRRGVAFHTASRGGDVTYHAPGQWVLYPILRLGTAGLDAHGYLFNLEEIALRVCASYGVAAHRVQGKNGAWTEKGKIAAIGFHLKRWITCHGMSFNCDMDMSGFQWIVPCGLSGDPVCSLRMLLGDRTPSLRAVGQALLEQFQIVCGRPAEIYQAHSVPEPVRAALAELKE